MKLFSRAGKVPHTHLVMNSYTRPTDLQRHAAAGSIVRWIDPYGVERSEPATELLLDAEVYRAREIRTGNHYPGQRNYHGYFYVHQVGHHVWHESLLEATAMLWLDLHEDIVAISAQPMQLSFGDGSIHYPDLLTMHGNGRQVLHDVKPTVFMTEKTIDQFSKTYAMCEQVGWGYRVHHELPEQLQINLEWLGAFRNPRFNPGPEATARLLEAVAMGPVTVLAAVQAVGMPLTSHARAAVYHLVAMQVLSIDLTGPLSDATVITERTPR